MARPDKVRGDGGTGRVPGVRSESALGGLHPPKLRPSLTWTEIGGTVFVWGTK